MGSAADTHQLGRYEVAGHLAAGGMAEVLLGRVSGPSGFERVVVLKRILPHLARQSTFVDMFLDEARIIARVHHPNVVNVHELCSANGELFMVMEYLRGESVSSLIRRLISRSQPISPRLAAFIVAEACAGLHAAHELRDDAGESLNVVHRDVSPQNVFITFDGVVKIIDFGIAKAADRIARTEAGDVKGKLDYMAPEQCKSEPLDRRTDVFALGIVLYELLAQRRLFKRPSPAGTVKAVLHDPIIPPSRIVAACPTSLDSVCMRALERDREKRYATALDMRRELMAVVSALGGERLPEEDLAALMQDVLADRQQLKEAMLASIREGSSLSKVPSPEASLDVDVPVVDAAEGTNGGASIGAALGTSKRSRWPMAVVAAIALLATGTAVVLANARSAREAVAPPAPPAAPSAQPSSVATTPATVHLTFETDPSAALVVIDGTSVGTTPAVLPFPVGSNHHSLVLRKAGYSDDQEDFVTDVDQKLRFQLKPMTMHAAPVRASSVGHKPASDQPSKW